MTMAIGNVGIILEESDMNHTPGEWRFSLERILPNEGLYVRVARLEYHDDMTEDEMCLIASAPELDAENKKLKKENALLSMAVMSKQPNIFDENEMLWEFYNAHWEVEKGIVDFDLHANAVERLRKAQNAIAKANDS